jgi:CysZ protein
LIFAGMVTGGVLSIDWALGFLGGDWGWFQWLHSLIYWLLYVLMLLLILLVSFFLTLVLSTIINSPFYDYLSERVEEVYLGRRFDEPWSWEYVKRTILVPIRESLKLALYQTLLTLGLFVVSLISGGLGTVLFALAAPYIAALGIFDFVMARKVYSLAEKRRYLRKNLPFAMGFGTLAYFLPLLTPFAIVGATLAFLSSRDK